MNGRVRTQFAAVIIAMSLIVVGCAANPTALDAETSQRWQAQVLAIAQSAEAGDPAAALRELDALEVESVQARDAGEITAERAAIIQQAIDLVRADLEPAPVPAEQVPEDTVPDETDPAPGTDSENDDDTKNDDKKNEDKKNEDKKNDNSGKGGKGGDTSE